MIKNFKLSIFIFLLIFFYTWNINLLESPDNFLSLGLKYEEENNIKMALYYYDKFLKIEKNEKIELKIARITPEYNLSVEKYNEFINNHPKSQFLLLARYELANLHNIFNKIEASLNEFKIILDISTKSSEYFNKAFTNIIQLEYELGFVEQTLNRIEKTLSYITDYETLACIYFIFGKIMKDKNEYKIAENYFLTCAGSFPLSSKAEYSLLELMKLYILTDRVKYAFAVSKMIQQIYPNSMVDNEMIKSLNEKKISIPDNETTEIKLIHIENKNITSDNKISQIKKDIELSLNFNDVNIKKNITLKDQNDAFYYIQLGYYSSLDYAKKMIDYYKKNGISEAYYKKTKSPKSAKIFYRVLIGPYNSKEKANEKNIILKKKNIESIVLELKNDE